MLVTKTVKIPVHYAITKRKLHILDALTARTTYGVWIWSRLFKGHKLKGTYADRRRFYDQVKKDTKLGTMTQCCFDTAAWMWKGYYQLHKDWQRKVINAQRGSNEKWLRKLLKREPQEPFTNGMNSKIPIWFDNRFGSIKRTNRMKLCPYVVRVSTLRIWKKLTIPLNPAKYHLDLLESGTVKSFQLVKRDGKYFVHVNVEYEVPDQPVFAVRGIDLGVKRSVASVTLRPNQPLRSSDFSILTDGLKRNRLDRLNKQVAELKRAKKWAPLNRLRHKRRHVSEQYDRLAAKQVATASQGNLVVVGYPKGLKYENFKGNGNARKRRALSRWTYGRMMCYFREECVKQGIPVETVDERWSSRTCHRCGSRHTERITQSVFHCWDCELIYNADYNAAINIGSRFLPMVVTRRATDDLAYTGDEQAREIVACKPRSPCLKGAWS